MTARIVISLALALAACGSGASSTGIEELACSPTSTLTYENYGKAAIMSACMSCHDTESPRLGTQAAIQSRTSELLDVAVYTDAMPEDGTMTIEERRMLGEWLACGAP